MKELTFAVFIVKRIGDLDHLFMAHSTGNKFWDVPKGGAEDDEKAIESALRELVEETGIVFQASDLLDMGIFQYNRRKHMHVFLYTGDNYPRPDECLCTSTFTCNYTQRERPEVDDFKYVPFSEVTAHCAKSFNNVFDVFLIKYNDMKVYT